MFKYAPDILNIEIFVLFYFDNNLSNRSLVSNILLGEIEHIVLVLILEEQVFS